MKQYSSVVARDLSFTYAKRYIEDIQDIHLLVDQNGKDFIL